MSGTFATLLFLCFCFSGLAGQADSSPPVRRVAVLASYHAGQPWTDALVGGIRGTLEASGMPLAVSIEYLDAKRHGHRLFPTKSSVYQAKYSSFPQHLIFVCDDDALQFYQQYGSGIWPGTPVVFVGVNDHSKLNSLPRHLVTGVMETFSLDPFLAAVRAAHGSPSRIVVVNDDTTTGLVMRDSMREYASRHKNLEFEFLDGAATPLPEILLRLRRLRSKDLVLASMFTADRTRKDYQAEATQSQIANASQAPVASPTTSELGFGYLCGRANNGRGHGEFAARLGLKVLGGVDPAAIPIVQHDIIGLIVDAQAAARWDIPISRWPPDTQFVNRPAGMPSTNRMLFVLALGFILIQTAIIAALVVNRARRRKAEQALRESEESLELAQKIAHLGSWVRNLDTGELLWSQEVYRLYGLAPGSIRPNLDYVLSRIHPDEVERVRGLIARADLRNSNRSMEYRMIREDGAERHVKVRAEFRKLPNGHREVNGTIQDITEIREMEAQVRHVQKMESVGQLAGGVAHDFNNLLTVINGYSQLLLRRLEPGSPEHRRVEEILRAGEKAAGLTRQLLAFGRRQVMNPVTVEIPAVVHSMMVMLQTVLGESIRLELRFENPQPVEADPAQLEQVILNLVLNARDAMPGGGRLTIAAMSMRVSSSSDLRTWDLEPGDYTLLTVADTGTGMDDATRARAFEPFFTTKPTGKGSGLGLATVYGVVKQSGGHVALWSKPGVGTEVRLYLPVSGAQKPVAALAIPHPEESASPLESILLVEDQESVRNLASETLSALGYRVWEAANGEEALRLSSSAERAFGLVVTDVVMPGINGPQLATELRKANPKILVLYMTGYAGDALGAEKGNLLLKPFLPSDLALKVREILNQRPNTAPAGLTPAPPHP